MSIHFDREQVANKEHERLNPERYDFRWNADFSECDAIPLLWWNDSSYAAYQGDTEEGDDHMAYRSALLSRCLPL